MLPQIVAFDLGGVIANPAAQDRLAATQLQADPDAVAAAYAAHRYDYDAGTVSARDYWGAVATQVGASMTDDLADELARQDAQAWSVIAAETHDLMREVHEAKVPIVILSNAPLALRPAIEAAPWSDIVRQLFLSSELGIMKPNQAIYDDVAQVLDVAPERIWFTDDKAENIDGARSADWQGHVWTGADDARKSLLDAGVLTD